MRRVCLVGMILLALALGAYANSFPIFTLTQGTITATPTLDSVSLLYNFSGPGGVNFSGLSTNTNFCGFIVAGNTCAPGGITSPFDSSDFSAAVVAGTQYSPLYSIGGIAFSGPAITLPQPTQATFTITVPVLFSGTFTACVADLNNFGACSPQQVPAQFSVNGKGTGTLVFTTDFFNSGAPVWSLASATYTLNPVPEPSSVMLLGTGALALVSTFRRRR